GGEAFAEGGEMLLGHGACPERAKAAWGAFDRGCVCRSGCLGGWPSRQVVAANCAEFVIRADENHQAIVAAISST
ncbi:hypothetical protein, partial [Pseudomonas guariconensis]|uniref:hypothetical protein n=1 Tax=Pseudomonas guariconensis TaxID=1288410 RepID=UPI002D1F0EE9